MKQSVSNLKVKHQDNLTPAETILLNALDEAYSYIESLQYKTRSQNTKLRHGDALNAIVNALDCFENNLPGFASKL